MNRQKKPLFILMLLACFLLAAAGTARASSGGGGITGLAHAGEMINLTRALLRKRFNKDDLRGIWGENFLRVMRTVQQAGV